MRLLPMRLLPWTAGARSHTPKELWALSITLVVQTRRRLLAHFLAMREALLPISRRVPGKKSSSSLPVFRRSLRSPSRATHRSS